MTENYTLEGKRPMTKTTPHTAPVEVIAEHSPDSGVTVTVVVDGQQVDAETYVVDPGAGWDWLDWKAYRDEVLTTATPVAAELFAAAYAAASEWDQYVDLEGHDAFDDLPAGVNETIGCAETSHG